MPIYDTASGPGLLVPLQRAWRAALAVAVLAGMLLVPLSVAGQTGSDDGSSNPYWDGPVQGSGEGRRIGYISIGDAGEFTTVVNEGIRDQAAVAGFDLVVCDSRFNPEEAIVCGRQLDQLGVEGVLNFQISEEDSERVCSSYGDLPTLAIDVHQAPCERSFVGADNLRAGFLTGEAVGLHLQAEQDCGYDTVFALGGSEVGIVSVQRVGGMVEGFASICGPVPEARLRPLDTVGSYEVSLETVSAELEELPIGGIHVVLALNDSSAFGADDAARRLGRESELRIGSQGALSMLDAIACDDHWIAASAYFPERYGHILIGAMVDLLDGVDIPSELFVPHVAVTADNVADIYGEAPDCTPA